MYNNEHIKLFELTRLLENVKATEIIKNFLIDSKSENFSFRFTISEIEKYFETYEKEHITSLPQFKFLLNIFERGKRKFESYKTLLVIPNLLKHEFETIDGLEISFNEYLVNLANRISFSKALSKFHYNEKLYEGMYEIGRFDGYKYLPEFDVRWFKNEPNYFNLEKEISILVKDKLGIKTHIDKKKNNEKTTLPGNKLFKFQSNYNVIMQEKIIFEILKKKYFHPNTKFEDYLNVFFNNPEEHNSKIYLICQTKTFCRLLHEFKESIAHGVDYTKISSYELFITQIKQTPLTRLNISNSLRKSNEDDNKIAKVVIDAAKKSIQKC